MHNYHPHVAEIHNQFIKLFQGVAKVLCTKQLPGFGITSKTEQQEGNVAAEYFNCVLTADGRSGIIPLWFVIYKYDKVQPDFKAQAMTTMIGPKALQSVNAKPMGEVFKKLQDFEKTHKNQRYEDATGAKSARVGDAIALMRKTLLSLDSYVTGQVFEINPDTDEPDDRIVMIDLFLKDPADVDVDGVFQTKIKLIFASPEFVQASLVA